MTPSSDEAISVATIPLTPLSEVTAAAEEQQEQQEVQRTSPKKTSFLERSFSVLSWINSALGLTAIIVAIYFGWRSLVFQRWSAKNDFRDSCKDAKVRLKAVLLYSIVHTYL